MRPLLTAPLLFWLLTLTLQAAPIRWNLMDVGFVDGGTVSGYFLVDGTSATDWSLTASGGRETVFPALTYTPANTVSVLYWGSDGCWTIAFQTEITSSDPDITGKRILLFQFENSLLTPRPYNALINGPDWSFGAECWNCGPARMIVSGGAAGEAPEPGGYAAPGGGLAALLALRSRRLLVRRV